MQVKSSLRLPAQFLDSCPSLLTEVNQYARSEKGPFRKSAYHLKHRLLSVLLTSLPEQVEVDYQFDGRSASTLVLVRLHGTRKRVFHAPFEQLDAGARARIINLLGTPSEFVERFSLLA